MYKILDLNWTLKIIHLFLLRLNTLKKGGNQKGENILSIYNFQVFILILNAYPTVYAAL